MGGVLALVALIVVPFVLWSIFGPKSQWQALSSWKYRNPEANEPSEAAYAMTRIGGVVGLVALVVVGVNMVQADRKYQDLTAPKTTEPYVVPAPKDLGPVPVVDYFVMDWDGKPSLQVTFVFSGTYSPNDPCTLIIESSGLGTEGVTVNARARWAPTSRADEAMEWACKGAWGGSTSWRRLGETPPNVVVVTDGPVYNPKTKVLTPAAPGNPLPVRELNTPTPR